MTVGRGKRGGGEILKKQRKAEEVRMAKKIRGGRRAIRSREGATCAYADFRGDCQEGGRQNEASNSNCPRSRNIRMGQAWGKFILGSRRLNVRVN